MEQGKNECECCGIATNKNSEQQFWDSQYQANTMGWDMGEVSPPIKNYIAQLIDKNIRILIPGCGNCYEAEYLLQSGFANITLIDIAPTLVEKLEEKFKDNSKIRIVLGDFFEHKGEYDLIFEQTFFCALNPAFREKYCDKMKSLLAENGKLIGVLFDKEFEKAGPPFGGNKSDYENLFKKYFELIKFEKCYNSFHKRQDTELFIILKKKK